jgi:hypothetical protein
MDSEPWPSESRLGLISKRRRLDDEGSVLRELPQRGQSPDLTAIDDKRRQLPFLGNPVDEDAVQRWTWETGAAARDYENGSIYFTPQTGAHEVHGDIRLEWARLRGHRGFLGYPITDETGCPDG